MRDIFGFPRRSEVQGAAGFSGIPWKVFWSSPPHQGVNAVTIACPYAFPARYFHPTPSEYGLPESGTNVSRQYGGASPYLRFFAFASGTGSTTFNVSVQGNGGSTTILALNVNPNNVAGASSWGYIFQRGKTTLTEVVIVNDVTPSGSASAADITATYGQQDLWFSLTVPANNWGFCIVEYLDLPF